MKNYLTKGRFSRNIASVVSGTIIAQMIVFAAIPLLTRLYTPSDFGLLATYSSLLGIIAIIANFRYQLAIPLADTEREASALLILNILTTSFTTIIVLIAVFFLEDLLISSLNYGEMAKYIWILPIGVFFMGLYQAFTYWAIRGKDLRVVAKTKIYQAIVMVSTQIAFFKFNTLALIIGHTLGQTSGVVSLSLPVIKSKVTLLKTITFREVIVIAKRYKNFPLVSSWAGLLNGVGNLAPNILFAVLYSPAAAGLFFLASRIISTPISILGRAIGQSFYVEAVEAHKSNQLSGLLRNTSKKLLLLILIPAIVTFVAGEEIITLLLGYKWRDSGVMVEWLSIMMVAQFIISPISNVFSITEQQIKGLILQMNLSVLRVGSIFTAHLQEQSILNAIIYFSVASSVGYLVFFVFAMMDRNGEK